MKKRRKRQKNISDYYGHGFIMKKVLGSRNLFKYLWSLTKPFSNEPQMRRKYHRFICHVYASMRFQVSDKDHFRKQKGYVPISGRLIEKEFRRGFDVNLLNKLLDIIPHSWVEELSQEFKLKDNIYKKAVRISHDDTLSNWKKLCKGQSLTGKEIVNLLTGRRMSSVTKSEYCIEDKIKEDRNTNTPPFIQESMKSLMPCPFNPKYTYRWIKRLKEKYERESARFEEIKKNYDDDSPEYELAESDYLKAHGRYHNDLLSMETILNQIPQKLPIRSTEGDPLYEYKAAYRIQISGRISEIHGGFQSASRYFKRSLLRRMYNMRKNYDLKDSQANILLQELENCNIKCKWLKSYLADPEAKQKYADRIGIPKDVWKECFYAMVMGANARSRIGAIYSALLEHFRGDKKEAGEAQKRFVNEVQKLIKATDNWRNYIYETESQYSYSHRGVKFWKNACTLTFKELGIKDFRGDDAVLINRLKGNEEIKGRGGINACKRRLAAFILQGQEACFIHKLTILCAQNGIPVYKNEHDGLITGKKIPETLITEAASKSRLKKPILDRKQICSKEKRKEAREYIRR